MTDQTWHLPAVRVRHLDREPIHQLRDDLNRHGRQQIRREVS